MSSISVVLYFFILLPPFIVFGTIISSPYETFRIVIVRDYLFIPFIAFTFDCRVLILKQPVNIISCAIVRNETMQTLGVMPHVSSVPHQALLQVGFIYNSQHT